MKKNQLARAIHKTMREAGYKRKTARRGYTGPKVYVTRVGLFTPTISVHIPGTWSIPLRKQFASELMEVLSAFNPRESSYLSGVVISFEE